MRISDWSSDVCSSDLQAGGPPWGGFVTLFPDPEFPHFGAVLASEAVADDPSCAEIVISGAEAFELEAIAAVVQRCCAETLAKKPIGFEWADSCSRARPDAFGGGWCAIFADRLEFETNGQALYDRKTVGVGKRVS